MSTSIEDQLLDASIRRYLALRARDVGDMPTADDTVRVLAARTARAPAEQRRPLGSAKRLIWALAILVVGASAVVLSVAQSPPAPPWTPPIGLVTETVLPGLDWIVSDGAGHDSCFWQRLEMGGAAIRAPTLRLPDGQVWRPEHQASGPCERRASTVAFGPDGAIWSLGHMAPGFAPPYALHDGLFRFGEPGSHPGPELSRGGYADLTVAAEGTLWAISGPTVASFADGTWTQAPGGIGRIGALEVLPDGTVWAHRVATLERLDGDRWTTYSMADSSTSLPVDDEHVFVSDLARTPDGSLWVGIDPCDGNPQGRCEGGLARFDGTSWEVVNPLGDVRLRLVGAVATAPDGSLWAYLETIDGVPSLAHLVDGSWRTYGAADRVPRAGIPFLAPPLMVVGADGTLWLTTKTDLVAFDGETWTTPWPSHPGDNIAALVAAPDGSVWVPTYGLGVFIVRH